MGLIRDLVSGGLCLGLFLTLWAFSLKIISPTTLTFLSLEGYLVTYGDVAILIAAVVAIGIAVPIRDFVDRLGKRGKKL